MGAPAVAEVLAQKLDALVQVVVRHHNATSGLHKLEARRRRNTYPCGSLHLSLSRPTRLTPNTTAQTRCINPSLGSRAGRAR